MNLPNVMSSSVNSTMYCRTEIPKLFPNVSLAVVLPTIGVVATRGYSAARWYVAASICLVSAALITPADLLTMLVLAVAFFAVLVLGSRIRLLDNPIAS
ncbi:hypothetical protein CA85_52040 [Allorhodopirellula solitaria]|uniref:Uncharacterized protein n=1 Tax=Allorhodopirellula solitaria TaxID=2527987 RepID=A0A5C5WMD2_9BACT|nr:hypothetical protein CA85_52040 [Allorhodopirellula solitaria]